MLLSVSEVKTRIVAGQRLLLAGGELALSLLPPGNWIGGTTPYFMTERGGVCTESRIFVTELPEPCGETRIRTYTQEDLQAIFDDVPDNGFSFILIPAGSEIHSAYAQATTPWRESVRKPIVGWIAGVHLSLIGDQAPAVFDGSVPAGTSQAAVVMHVELPDRMAAEVEVCNVFRYGAGDTIVFPKSGFEAKECMVNGESTEFMSYILRAKPDPLVPLTARYRGVVANVSIQGVDSDTGTVHFYAPVFAGMEYRFATPVVDYVDAFERAVPSDDSAFFSCNCVLNYHYAGLEGRRLGAITGPITFGEIAFRLLNQTLVRLSIRPREKGQ